MNRRCTELCLIFACIFNWSYSNLAQEINWTPLGIGGGGALFSPAQNPDDAEEIYLSSDLGAVFHTVDFGVHWEVISSRELSAAPLTEVQFSGTRRYALKHEGYYYTPVYSDDGGDNWQSLPSDPTNASAWFLFADPEHSDRILLSSYDELFYSDDGGLSFTSVYSADDLYIGGVFWNGSDIFVGCRTGLLLSENSGSSFTLQSPSGDLPANYGFLTFCGGTDGSTTSLFGVARDDQTMWPGMQGSEYWGEQEVYTLDWSGSQSWSSMNTGIDTSNFPFFVDMARKQVDTVYVAGTLQGWGYPMIWKSVDGGNQWIENFEPFGNANVYTGWQCEGGDQNWWWGGSPMGFEVSDLSSDRAVFTDFGFVHRTEDGGQVWKQGYVDTIDQNPPGDIENEDQYYHSNGLEPTSCWWLHGIGTDLMFAGFSDITGIRSVDSGMNWSFDYSGNDYNSTYHIISSADDSILYAATSSAHDIYQSVYLTDDLIDDATGEILYSTDGGSSWSSLYDAGHPVLWLAIDPNDPHRMYASLVDSEEGGIYSTGELDEGPGASWNKLTDPPRTEGHPYNIHVLEDSTLVSTFSARRDEGQFTLSSGVFVSGDQGNTWDDRSIAEMERWTKDIVIDPHDSTQSTWYACVFSHWGDPPNEVGGVYRTTDRGQNWDLLGDFYRVESCAVHPEDSNILFVTTESEGLWYTDEARANDPDFDSIPSYTFSHPLRMFFDPYDSDIFYISSFGNGIRKGVVIDTTPPVALCSNDSISLDSTGIALLLPSDIDDGSFDNDGIDTMWLSQDTFSCADTGTHTVTLTVMDESGNSAACTATVWVECTPMQHSLSGHIETAWGTVVEDVSVTLSGTESGTAPTDGNGDYSTTVTGGANVTLAPGRDIDYDEGISTLDLVIIQSHILGLNPFGMPEQYIAADASNDQNISTFDLVQIQSVLLGLSSQFPANESWRFVRSDYVFPDPSDPWTPPFPEDTTLTDVQMDVSGLDFTGIKIGDVDGSYSP